MVDLSQTIIPKSDQLNADDLVGGAKIFTIVKVSKGPSKEQPVNIYMEGIEDRPWRPCLTMRRVMAQLWDLDASTFVGKRICLFRDPSVTWAGQATGGIRIKRMSHIDGKKEVMVTKSRNKREIVIVDPINDNINRTIKSLPDEPVNQSVTPAELSVDEQVNRFAKEFGARLGKGPFSEFDDWWKAQEEVRKLVPEERLAKIESALVKAIDGGWV